MYWKKTGILCSWNPFFPRFLKVRFLPLKTRPSHSNPKEGSWKGSRYILYTFISNNLVIWCFGPGGLDSWDPRKWKGLLPVISYPSLKGHERVPGTFFIIYGFNSWPFYSLVGGHLTFERVPGIYCTFFIMDHFRNEFWLVIFRSETADPQVSGLRPCFSSCRFPMAGIENG